MTNLEDWCPDPAPNPSLPETKQLAGAQLASLLCSKGMRPLLLTGILRDLLIRHFTAEHIEEADLRQLIWQPGETTGILVESGLRFRPELAEKRPAVIIKRNGYQNLRLAIGDQNQADQRGFEHFSTFWVGSHTLFCLHPQPAGVELLATEVQRELTQFGPALLKHLGLLRWQVQEVGPVAVLEESRGHFLVPVTLGWAYQEHWMLEQHSLPVRGFSLSILSEF